MLYFSLTVCVLTPSSSLPALEGARESSKGDANGPPYLLSLLPALSEDHDVLRELKPLCDGDLRGSSSSRNLRVLLLRGGSSSSADSCGPWLLYSDCPLACEVSVCCGAVPGLACAAAVLVNDRDDGCLEVCGRFCASCDCCDMSSRSSLPELMRICGGACLGGGEEVSESIAGAEETTGRKMVIVLRSRPAVKKKC